ncbi:SUR7 protein [Nemania sp. NC0429]|nr:SUR7 protein [Nemania sp. NC0429]
MGVGRYVCVALPFILTVASIIATLIVGLTGVANHDLYLFRIDVTNFSVDASELADFVNNVTSLGEHKNKLEDLTHSTSHEARDAAQDINNQIRAIVGRSPVEWHDPSLLDGSKTSDSGKGLDDVPDVESAKIVDSGKDVADNVADALAGTVIKASDIGLANLYDFNLWGLCVTPQDGKKNCTKAQFDWATHELDLTWVDRLTAAAGLKVTLPKQLNDGLNVYKTVTRWTEIVFIIAIVALALELIVGLFTACSRAVSCVTWIISGFATIAIIATAILLTVTGVSIIGVVLTFSKHYGVRANLNTSFLVVLWLGVAFALGAGLFWLFSICCCKPENRPHGKATRHADSEKFPQTSSYAPLGENRNSAFSGYNYGAPQRGGPRTDLAYEPYSHSRV